MDLLSRWECKGGVLLIGYSAFRNLSLGKHVKDKNTAKQICQILQVNQLRITCSGDHQSPVIPISHFRKKNSFKYLVY